MERMMEPMRNPRAKIIEAAINHKLDSVPKPDWEQSPLEAISEGQTITDIENAMDAFTRQREWLEGNSNVLWPAIELESQFAPIDIEKTVAISLRTSSLPSENYDARTIANVAQETLSRSGFKTTRLPQGEARLNFVKALTGYIETRLATARDIFNILKDPETFGVRGMGAVGVPGIEITVETIQQNLQVLCTPAFFPSTRSAFGNGLSTPVKGVIAPGIYLFGAQDKSMRPRFEKTQFKIPPVNLVHLVSM